GGSVSFAAVEKIANAVLYEGYLLYPYRKSSVKNQKRWHFGTLEPGGGEESFMRTQVLAMGTELSSVEIRIRFLQGEEEREILLDPLPLSTSRVTRTFHFPPIDAEIGVNCD